MPTVREVRAALSAVQAPVLHRSLLEPGMLRNIAIERTDGGRGGEAHGARATAGQARVSLDVAVVRAGGVLHPGVADAIVAAVGALAGVDGVTVAGQPMTSAERGHAEAVAARAAGESVRPASGGGAPLAALTRPGGSSVPVIGIASGKGGSASRPPRPMWPPHWRTKGPASV